MDNETKDAIHNLELAVRDMAVSYGNSFSEVNIELARILKRLEELETNFKNREDVCNWGYEKHLDLKDRLEELERLVTINRDVLSAKAIHASTHANEGVIDKPQNSLPFNPHCGDSFSCQGCVDYFTKKGKLAGLKLAFRAIENGTNISMSTRYSEIKKKLISKLEGELK